MNSAELAQAAASIQAGALVGMPTETVYGLAADATNAEAVARIFAAKARPHFDPLIVHVAGIEQAAALAEVDQLAVRLMQAFWPGPLTLVLRRCPESVPDLVTSGLETVGLRCPDHPLALALIRQSGCPLAAPSANKFGKLSPTSAAAVQEQLGDAVAVVLDGGPCRVGVESTVLRLDPEPVILRPGGVTPEQLSAVIGQPVPLATVPEISAGLPAEAPGMLASHYAPRTPLQLKPPREPWPIAPDIGRLAFTGQDLPEQGGPSDILSPSGDDVEAAHRLFACLRRLDASGARLLIAEPLPETGLGLAINDRLQRAAAPKISD